MTEKTIQELISDLYDKATEPNRYYFDKFDCEVTKIDKDSGSITITTKFTNPSPALRNLIEKQEKIK